MQQKKYDAVIIGSGPNGFAAGIKLAQNNLSVLIIEAKGTIGGGMRSSELTLPDFTHDVCSAVHPLGFASPFFKKLPLEEFGLKWIFSPASLAHPLKDDAVMLYKNINETSEQFGEDVASYKKIFSPILKNWDDIEKNLLGPPAFPRHPIKLAAFGVKAIKSSSKFIRKYFREEKAKSLFSGLAAHSMLPLNKSISASFGLVLGTLAHKSGWPIPSGGSQNLADALLKYFLSLGGEVRKNFVINNFEEIPEAKTILFDITPKQILKICGDKFHPSYKKQLQNYRYGAAVFKMDWALNEPIPFKNKKCKEAATVHIGGSFKEIETYENGIAQGIIGDKPFVILVQPTLFDKTRAPKNKHTAWAYCHLPNGSNINMIDQIENQIERFAPGFQDCIIGRHSFSPLELQKYNPNYIGGDINGGMQDIFQLYTRPAIKISPYSTSVNNIFICSSSTPPGGGVHGMCGFYAAEEVIKKIFK